jgi:predicted transglutaminase-like cysteine proteinase
MSSCRTSLFYLPVCMYACLLIVSQPAFASRVSYFDMDETRSENITPFPKWTGTVSRYGDQKKVPDSECGKVRYHPCSVLEWKAMLESLRGKPFRQQLTMINNWSNEHPYIEDQVNWGIEDYWDTPYEFMEISGDCEDYAISKYYSLKALGVPVEHLRIIVLQDLNLGGIIHAVLGVYDDGELYILDNQSQQVKPALKIYHYRPIFGINETSWWAYYPK